MLEKFSVNADPGSTTLVITRVFDAPSHAVFDAWTESEQVTHWWDPSGAPLAVCEIDLRPGGLFRWVSQHDRVMEHPFTGAYREIAPPARLVFSARVFPSSPESIATLSFIEDGGKTKFTMTIECQSIEHRDALLAMRVDVGTARTLENLAAFLVSMTEPEKLK